MNLDLKFLDTKNIAIATSGGADSLALCFILKEKGYNFTSLIVDHNYRENSAAEAKQVKKVLNEHNIKAEILTVSKKPPVKNIEEELRKLRYNLLLKYCRENKVDTLLTAHHLDDNIETMLMRLAKGSGVKGLSGINKVVAVDGVKIYRPLLKTDKEELVNYLKAKNISWFEDETNKSDKFTRNRLRKALAQIEGPETLSKNMSNSIVALKNTSEYIEFQAQKEFKKVLKVSDLGFVLADLVEFLGMHEFMALECLRQVIEGLKFSDKNLRYREVEQVYKNIKLRNKSFTLHGIEFMLQGEKLYIFKELSRMKEIKVSLGQQVWAKNFDINIAGTKNTTEGICIKSLNNNYKLLVEEGGDTLLSFAEVPNKILKTLPCLHLANSIILPHINGASDKGNIAFTYKFKLNHKVF